jgi:predicted transcriptional regulator
MAMTLRLPAEDSVALARTAELESRSQNDVIVTALREYIERNSRAALIDQVMESELPRYAEALERLGQ